MFRFKFKIKFKRSPGQTIIEAAVALVAMLLVLSAITIAVVTSVSNSDFIKKQTLAKKYAEQGMEYIRYLRNNNPGGFFLYTGVRCMNDTASPTIFENTSCENINIGNYFKREANFNHGDSQCGQDISGVYGSKVTVTVSWTSGKCSSGTFCHSSRLVSCFSTIPESLKTL